ncbi:MAG: hypothetical protein Q7S64_00985 [bacterium]|nr:hypothetical protein [bacterium]
MPKSKKQRKHAFQKTKVKHELPKDIDKKVEAAVDRIVKEYGEVLKKLGDG